MPAPLEDRLIISPRHCLNNWGIESVDSHIRDDMYLSFEEFEHMSRYSSPWKWNWMLYGTLAVATVYKIHRTIDARSKYMAWKRSTAYGQMRIPKKMQRFNAQKHLHTPEDMSCLKNTAVV